MKPVKEKVTYIQCKMQRMHIVETAYIPSQFANVGGYVKLKQLGQWIDGWEILEISSFYRTHQEVIERSQYYKTQREGSDI